MPRARGREMVRKVPKSMVLPPIYAQVRLVHELGRPSTSEWIIVGMSRRRRDVIALRIPGDRIVKYVPAPARRRKGGRGVKYGS